MSVGVKALPVPADDNDYLCVFGTDWTVVGTVSPNEIKCYTPPPRLFAPLFDSINRGISTLIMYYDYCRSSSSLRPWPNPGGYGTLNKSHAT